MKKTVRILTLFLCIVILIGMMSVTFADSVVYERLDLSATEYTELDVTGDADNKKFNTTQLVVKGIFGSEAAVIAPAELTYESSNAEVAELPEYPEPVDLGEGIIVVDSNDADLDDGVVIDNGWETNRATDIP